MSRGGLFQRLRGGPQRQAWLQFVRFGFAGLVNAAFCYAVFAALLLAGAPPLAALVAATGAGIVFNFQTSRRLVFRSRGRGLRFVAVYGAVLVLNWVALQALRQLGLSALEAQALLTLPLAAASFLGQKAFVFGPAAGRA